MKPNEIEFISEIATQLTELNFHEDTFVLEDETDVKLMSNVIHQTYKFTEDAQDFFNERYDEIETLYINLIKNK
jgi:hypothetical protein|tara:strand:- start:54 stop:275 length:222 start_codon:yes stop_codon:yes gene_type:complete